MLKNNLRTHSPQENENAVLTTAGYFKVSTPVLSQRQWKRVFTVYSKKKSKHHHWILHIQIILGTKFQPKLTILIFWTKFAEKGFFQSTKERVNTTIEFRKFELVATKFQVKLTILIFWTKFAQKGYFRLETCTCVHGRYLLY